MKMMQVNFGFNQKTEMKPNISLICLFFTQINKLILNKKLYFFLLQNLTPSIQTLPAAASEYLSAIAGILKAFAEAWIPVTVKDTELELAIEIVLPRNKTIQLQ
jgi:hypothetical protein